MEGEGKREGTAGWKLAGREVAEGKERPGGKQLNEGKEGAWAGERA